MQTLEPVVRANVLAALGPMLAKTGGDHAQLLADAGLTAADLEDPQRYISLNTVAELFDLAAFRTKDARFGLHYAEAFPVGGSGLLGQLMLSAATVGDALRVAQQYVEVHATQMRVTLEQHDAIYSLQIGYPASFTAPQLHYTDFLFAMIVLRLRLGAGPAWRPYAVELAHRKPDDIAGYEAYFGPRITFDAPRNRLDVLAEDFDKPMPKVLDQLSVTLRKYGKLILAEEQKRQSLGERLGAVLHERLENEQRFDLDAVAEQLAIPVRALQARLDQAGTSYDKLLTRARRRMAVHLLRDTDLPITQIAGRLGYSEASPFTRAAQKWFNATPTAHRKKLRESGPDKGDEDGDA
jgi:AraC-like DNA-binding protein